MKDLYIFTCGRRRPAVLPDNSSGAHSPTGKCALEWFLSVRRSQLQRLKHGLVPAHRDLSGGAVHVDVHLEGFLLRVPGMNGSLNEIGLFLLLCGAPKRMDSQAKTLFNTKKDTPYLLR